MYILLAYLHSTDSLAQEQMASKICCVSTFPLPTPTPRGFSHHFGESTRGPRTHPRLRTATVMNARLEYVVWDPSSKNQLPSTEMVLTCWFCCHAPARMPSNKMLAAPLVQAKLNDALTHELTQPHRLVYIVAYVTTQVLLRPIVVRVAGNITY